MVFRDSAARADARSWVIYATRMLLPPAAGDQALDQVVNVAALPGIVEASYAMPYIH